MVATNAVHEARESMRETGALLGQMRQRIGTWDVRSGRWFQHLVEAYLEAREEHRERVAAPEVTDETRIAQGNALIRRAAATLAASGAAAAAGWTAATMSAANTQGLAGILTIPLAGLGSGAELILRSVVQLRLTCDISELYGIAVEPNHRDDVMRIYALALDMVEHGDVNGDELGRKTVEHMVGMDTRAIGKAIGSKLLSTTVVCDVVPFFGVGAAALANVTATVRLGRIVRGYLTYRRELLERLDVIERRSPRCVEPLVQGLWSVLTATGHLDAAGSALLADILRGRPHATRRGMLDGFVPGSDAWIEQLRQSADEHTQALALQTLAVAAAADADAAPAEYEVLHRAAQALRRPFRPEDLDELARQVERTGRVAMPGA